LGIDSEHVNCLHCQSQIQQTIHGSTHVLNSQLNRTCLCPCQAIPQNLLIFKHSSVAEPSIRSLHLPSKQSASDHAGSLHSRTLRSPINQHKYPIDPGMVAQKSSIPSQSRTSPEPPPSLPICINAPTSTQVLTLLSLGFVLS
jgi:hypothetical protein